MRNSLQRLLNKYRFVATQARINSPYFGNFIDCYASPEMRMRVVMDRGREYIELAPIGGGDEDWKDAFTVVAAVSPSFVPKTGSLEEVIEAFDNNYAGIASLLVGSKGPGSTFGR